MQPANRNRILYFFIGIAVILNFSGLFVPIMALDAARYASIAKTMVLSNNYVELYCDRMDWLDKPHFPFWLTAFSFKLFGINTVAYKIPGILFLLVGAWYTYLLGRKLYNKEVGLWSALILLTAEHIVISNNDVRAEPYLTGLIIPAVYHYYLSYKQLKLKHLVFASLFAACAVMTKGIFALVPIAAGIGGELIIKKDWRSLFHWRWLVAAALVLLFITPELYALYHQFDMHPEKVVFERTNVSGLKFFFWDSQFGRFFNTGPIKGEGDPLFFIHTILWAFLPWSILFFVAVADFIKRYRKERSNVEWICLFASAATFLMFSASSFQLPHYINIVFPFFAIITAAYIYRVQKIRTVNKVQWVITILLLLLVAAISVLFHNVNEQWPVFFLLASGVTALVWLLRTVPDMKYRIIYVPVIGSIVVNLFLNLSFYPELMKYQSGSEAAFWLNNRNNTSHNLQLPVASDEPSYPLDFYLHQHLHLLFQPHDQPSKPFILYTSMEQLGGRSTEIIATFDEFPVTRLDMQFVNKNTRDEAVKKMVLAVIR